MNPYYDKLINFDGARGLDRLVRKWAVLSSNLKTLPVNGPVLLPDLFVVSHSDTMLSKMVDTLSSYLITQKNLMEFSGDVPYFEFMLNYCPPGAGFAELKRLIDGISDCAGYRNEFRGIVHIKLDYWLGHQEEHHFVDLLDYLAENTCSWLVILSVSTKNEEKVSDMESMLSMFLRIERITLHRASTPTYVSEIEDLLGSLSMTARESFSPAPSICCARIDILTRLVQWISSAAISYTSSTQEKKCRPWSSPRRTLMCSRKTARTFREPCRKLKRESDLPKYRKEAWNWKITDINVM